MEVTLEQVSKLFSEAPELLIAHAEELPIVTGFPLDINCKIYYQMEEIGILRCYLMRDDSDEIQGYAIFQVIPDLKHSGMLTAACDSIYLKPEARRGMNALRLLRHTRDALLADGVHIVYHSVNALDFGPLLNRIGFKQMETVYAYTETHYGRQST